MTMSSNYLILVQLLLQYSTKIQEIGTLFRNAQADGNRDVTDTEVAASGVARDAQIEKTAATIDGVALR
jgi:hypothetical protein